MVVGVVGCYGSVTVLLRKEDKEEIKLVLLVSGPGLEFRRQDRGHILSMWTRSHAIDHPRERVPVMR